MFMFTVSSSCTCEVKADICLSVLVRDSSSSSWYSEYCSCAAHLSPKADRLYTSKLMLEGISFVSKEGVQADGDARPERQKAVKKTKRHKEKVLLWCYWCQRRRVCKMRVLA